MKTVCAAFRDYNDAEAAVHDLVKRGLQRDQISLIASDRTGEYARRAGLGAEVGPGVGTGAALGGAAGMILGIAALAIPGIGPIVAAGPLAAALTGAGIGAAAGGIVGALSDIGISKETADSYAEAVRRGGTVLAVRADGEDTAAAESVLERHGGLDIEKHVGEWRNQEWTGFDSGAADATAGDEGSPSECGPRSRRAESELATGRRNVRVYDPEMSVAPDIADPELQREYELHYSRITSYDRFADAYRFGYTLATDSHYADRDWAEVEKQARTRFEQDSRGDWGKMKDAVRAGWNRVRGIAG